MERKIALEEVLGAVEALEQRYKDLCNKKVKEQEYQEALRLEQIKKGVTHCKKIVEKMLEYKLEVL